MKNISEKIIAHRGASSEAPENTLSAINLAWSQEIQKVEVDVRLTKDNKVIVFHDEDLNRLCGVVVEIKKTSLKALQQYDVGSWKGKKWKGTYISELSDVLKTIPKGAKLIVEVKSNIQSLPFIIDVVYNYFDKVEFISFNFDVISALKKQLPQVKALWLLDLDYDKETSRKMLSVSEILKKIKVAKLDGIDVWGGRIANEEFISAFKRENLLVYVWTINTVEKAQFFVDLGVDGITTDKPAWLNKELNKKI